MRSQVFDKCLLNPFQRSKKLKVCSIMSDCDDDDVHICDTCQDIFFTSEEFLQHQHEQDEHVTKAVLIKESGKRSGSDSQDSQEVPRKKPKIGPASKVKSDAFSSAEPEDDNVNSKKKTTSKSTSQDIRKSKSIESTKKHEIETREKSEKHFDKNHNHVETFLIMSDCDADDDVFNCDVMCQDIFLTSEELVQHSVKAAPAKEGVKEPSRRNRNGSLDSQEIGPARRVKSDDAFLSEDDNVYSKKKTTSQSKSTSQDIIRKSKSIKPGVTEMTLDRIHNLLGKIKDLESKINGKTSEDSVYKIKRCQVLCEKVKVPEHLLKESDFLLDVAAEEISDEKLDINTPVPIVLTKTFRISLTRKVQVNIKKLGKWCHFPLDLVVSTSENISSNGSDMEVLRQGEERKFRSYFPGKQCPK